MFKELRFTKINGDLQVQGLDEREKLVDVSCSENIQLQVYDMMKNRVPFRIDCLTKDGVFYMKVQEGFLIKVTIQDDVLYYTVIEKLQ